jgi:hypothetical protein
MNKADFLKLEQRVKELGKAKIDTRGRPEIRKPKYNNTKVDGFDSKKERDYYQALKLREHAGEITAISRQVTFKLSVCNYIADFTYYDRNQKSWIVVDVKSPATKKLPVYRLKKKMMMNELNIEIKEV